MDVSVNSPNKKCVLGVHQKAPSWEQHLAALPSSPASLCLVHGAQEAMLLQSISVDSRQNLPRSSQPAPITGYDHITLHYIHEFRAARM